MQDLMDWKDAFIFKVSKQVDFLVSRSLTHILGSSSVHVSKWSHQDPLCTTQKTTCAVCQVLSAFLELLLTADDKRVFGQIFLLLQELSALLG